LNHGSFFEIEGDRGPAVRRAKSQPHRENWELPTADDALRGGAEKAVWERAAAATTHDDELGARRGCALGDLRGRAAHLDHRFDVDAFPERLCETPRFVPESFSGIALGAPSGPGGEIQVGASAGNTLARASEAASSFAIWFAAFCPSSPRHSSASSSERLG
jgi:hypothetical protein